MAETNSNCAANYNLKFVLKGPYVQSKNLLHMCRKVGITEYPFRAGRKIKLNLSEAAMKH